MDEAERTMPYATARKELDRERILRIKRIVHRRGLLNLFGQSAENVVAGSTSDDLTLAVKIGRIGREREYLGLVHAVVVAEHGQRNLHIVALRLVPR